MLVCAVIRDHLPHQCASSLQTLRTAPAWLLIQCWQPATLSLLLFSSLREAGVKNIRCLTVVSCPEGVKATLDFDRGTPLHLLPLIVS